MRIEKITDEKVVFDNGHVIWYDHNQDCCEWNYADFEQIDDLARAYDFKEPLVFEYTDGAGFRFGDDKYWAFVPCYSRQSGYYSDEISIYYNDEQVLSFNAEEII